MSVAHLYVCFHGLQLLFVALVSSIQERSQSLLLRCIIQQSIYHGVICVSVDNLSFLAYSKLLELDLITWLYVDGVQSHFSGLAI